MDWRLRSFRHRRTLDIVCVDAIMNGFICRPNVAAFAPDEVRKYLDATGRADYWHGTGRWQYDAGGSTVDVLSNLLKNGGVHPSTDVFDKTQGEMQSISVARQRMYARIYGDMHEYGGAKADQRYGSPRFWAYYFIMAINLHATKELGLWGRAARRAQRAEWRKLAADIWAVKVNRKPASTGAFFANGSDIVGNYPIIFGIKKAGLDRLKTADYVARYESRIGCRIPIESFTHVEVPKAHVSETEAMLNSYGYDVPVFAFEQCEELYSNQPFSILVAQTKD